MAEYINCGNCGKILSEPHDTSIDKRKPCEFCGSTKRSFTVEIFESLKISSELKSSIISYPDTLLTISDNLINQGYFNIAVVTAIMACEVAIERAFDSVYKAKGMVDIGEAIRGLMNGNSLANDKHRKLFNSLTNIKLEKQRFWQNYKEACQKRNSIIHKGGHAIKSEADLALEAAHEMVNFLFKLEWTE